MTTLDEIKDGMTALATAAGMVGTPMQRAIWNAALEAAAKTCEQYGARHDDIRRAALEMCAENIRAKTRPLTD